MFQRLKERWKVNSLNLILIICTFAVGGSICGYLGRKILLLLNIPKEPVWVLLYILLITLLWPVCVIAISIVFGQFSFFKKYLQRIGKKLNRKKYTTDSKIINIAIFASGTGSNARQIINYFSSSPIIKVTLMVCNNPKAGVRDIAVKENIPFLLVEKNNFFRGDHYLPELHKASIGFIVLAGFLWKIPALLIKEYPQKILNLHPALLPKYGGGGMYGNYVHEAVISAREKESGITIHYVDELYDHGEIIFQSKCSVEENDTIDTLSQKVRQLEHTHYAATIDKIIQKQNHS